MPNVLFRMHVLMAGHGDCLWVEYGDVAAPHRILIDGGTPGTFSRVKAALDHMQQGNVSHELMVVTHIDADHIGGSLPVISGGLSTHFAEIWFNGRSHLSPGKNLESFGAYQGEKLTFSIREQAVPWNVAFLGKQVSLGPDGRPKEVGLKGGSKITILSPGWDQLNALLPEWDAEVIKAGLVPGVGEEQPVSAPAGLEALGAPNVDQLADEVFQEDDAKANGSSIAFLMEYAGKRVLFGADAHPSVLLSSIHKLTGGAPLNVDVFKLPHHGSKHNVSKELIQAVPASRYVFSSNGAYFKHPDKSAVARTVKYGPRGLELVFNCQTKFNDMWASTSLQRKWGYTARYGVDDEGISVGLL